MSRDPSGWERRILSPVLPKVEFEFMGTTLGPGVDTGGFLPRTRGWREYVAIEEGALLLTLDPVPPPQHWRQDLLYRRLHSSLCQSQ